MTRWFVIGAAVSFAWGSAAGAQQLKGLAPADIAAVARTRALDLRISRQPSIARAEPLAGGMIVSHEVAPNARLGIGLGKLYGRKKAGSDVRITGAPRGSHKPALKFVWRF